MIQSCMKPEKAPKERPKEFFFPYEGKPNAKVVFVEGEFKGWDVEYQFRFDTKTDAKDVFVAGDFNGWNPEADRLVKRNGAFYTEIRLKPGKHHFKFIVDGEWMTDPTADAQVENSSGSVTSVLHL